MMRILTWNIRGGLGMDGHRSLERIAAVIRAADADIACLQEVHVRMPHSGIAHQPRELQRLLGTSVLFGASYRLGPAAFGNAVVTRLPHAALRIHRLPNGAERRSRHSLLFERRSVMCVDVQADGRLVSVFNTHWSLAGEDRRAAGHEVARLARAAGPRCVLAGDFNAPADSVEMRLLMGDACLKVPLAGATYPMDVPRLAIDHVMVADGLQVARCEVLNVAGSDHLPVLAQVECAEPGPELTAICGGAATAGGQRWPR